MARASHGWLVATVCFTMAFFAWGAVFYGHGFYITALGQRHGWSTSLMSSAVASFWIVGIPATVLIGRVIDRHGTRWVAVYGALATGLGVAAIGHLSEPWQLFLVYPLLGSAYPALATATISGALVPWFDRRLGLALGIALTGASVGGAVVVPTMVALTESRGLTTTLGGLGAVIIVVVAPLVAAVLRRPRPGEMPDRKRSPETAPETGASRRSARDFLGDGIFWRISLASALALGAQVGFLTHQIPALEGTMGIDRAAYAVSLTAATAILGRFLLGALATRLAIGHLAAATYLVQALAVALVVATDQVALLYLASALAGLVVGCIVMLPPLLLNDAFGARAYGTAYGLANVALFLTVALTTSATGLLRDLTQAYTLPLLLLVGLHVIAAAIIIGRRRTA